MGIYVIDGTFEGLLTAVFEYYERKASDVQLVVQDRYQPSLLNDDLIVITDPVKAKRVWTGLLKKLDKEWARRMYAAWLSEDQDTFNHLLRFAVYIFDNHQGAFANYGNEYVLAVAQMERKVHREKHRMEAFIRFQKTGDGLFFAWIEPDFNVLPLIVPHFRNRYADQQWVIYDTRRKYGMYYDQSTVTEVTFEFAAEKSAAQTNLPALALDTEEALYTLLWKDYFKSTNIPARKNMKLHLRHVPKRYWRYLTEKWHA